jgi:8-oxo-dGTP diphosphatase
VTWTEPAIWYANLPTFHASAAAFITDPTDRVLLVKPTYSDHWAFPGGGVEPAEFPHHACAREVQEELGITPTVGELLIVDWAPPAGHRARPLIHFAFDCGVLSGVESFALPADELTDAAFLPPVEAERRLPGDIAAWVRAGIRARASHRPLYLPTE